jgi:hypothetical protein
VIQVHKWALLAALPAFTLHPRQDTFQNDGDAEERRDRQ